MLGELDILDASEVPAYNSHSTYEDRLRTIVHWITSNYDRDGAAFFDFTEYENGDELEDGIQFRAVSTSDILREVWGLFVSVAEFERLVNDIDREGDELWVPADFRIDIQTIEDEEDDEPVSLSDLQVRSKRIRDYLSHVSKSLPPGIGHNGPPGETVVNPETIDDLFRTLVEFEKLDEEEVDGQTSWLLEIAEKARIVGTAIGTYVTKKGDLFLDEATKEAGKQFGKWGTRGLLFLLASNSLVSFADDLIKLITDLF